ncbi:MAG TPA: alpha-amylase family glycosyl hydrolase [Anaerolineaceae bacterium]|nr:alpha-amylase family glycosyl hydrolase [Anaerolineaceae bacterium]HPN53256.1 alpha-amylase family glycosyl hydrolase [Anaerolineaceae bacterium]
MAHWSEDAIFYHIYPLGLCGAPERNDFSLPAQPRLERLYEWMDHITWLGANAVYLGPVFESTAHGYDTADYFTVDRRLGTNETLARVTEEFHRRGVRVVLDGVFNHTGRDFWAFRDILARGQGSPFCGWYSNLRFDQRSPWGDPFSYEGWAGNFDLARLNLGNPDVKNHLLAAVESWMRDFGIDGLRLDAADCVSLDFQRELAAFCRRSRPDFWLMGEVVHGDYRQWANPETLDSVTNYECYKGLYSSLNDANFFEIAYAFNRQFGPGGIYNGLPLYAFVDNHDVNRVASNLKDQAHLYPLYAMLMTMPGTPSIYYGSEFGLTGRKNGSDAPLRPALNLGRLNASSPQPELRSAIHRLAELRRQHSALRSGSYIQMQVAAQQFVFQRQSADERLVVALNSASQPAALLLNLPQGGGWLEDVLNPGEGFAVHNGQAHVTLPPNWARVMQVK